MLELAEMDEEFKEWLEGKTPEEMLSKAEELYQHGHDDTKCIFLCTKIQDAITDVTNPTRISATMLEALWKGETQQKEHSEELFEEALSLAANHLGKDSPRYIEGLLFRSRARLHTDTPLEGKPREHVISDLQEAIELLEKTPQDYRIIRACLWMQQVFARSNDDQQSFKYFQRGLNHCARICGEDDPEWASMIMSEASYYARNDEPIPADLENRIQAALQVLRSSFDEFDTTYRTCLEYYTEVLKRLGKESEAAGIEAELNRLDEECTKNDKDDQPHFREKLAAWRQKNGRISTLNTVIW